MRLLHLHSGNLYGGIETMLVTTARAPKQPEVDVSYALCFGGRLLEELTNAGAHCTRLGDVRLSRPATVIRARRTLESFIDRWHPDVVAVHGPWAQAVFGVTLRRAGLPLVLFVHGPLGGWLHTLGSRWPPAAVICNSEFTRGQLPAAYRQVPAAVIHNPMALAAPVTRPERCAIRRSFETAEDDVVIVQASRWEAWKGQAVHVRALAELLDLPGWTAWFVGGPQRPAERRFFDAVARLAERLGVRHRVRLVGQRSDVGRVLGAADVFCQPNTKPEPFGISYVEALGAGLPVVTSDLGAAPEVVSASSGRLVGAGDHAAVAAALRRLMTSSSERDRLGRAAKARAAELCDAGRQLSRTYEFIRTSLVGRSGQVSGTPLQ